MKSHGEISELIWLYVIKEREGVVINNQCLIAVTAVDVVDKVEEKQWNGEMVKGGEVVSGLETDWGRVDYECRIYLPDQ